MRPFASTRARIWAFVAGGLIVSLCAWGGVAVGEGSPTSRSSHSAAALKYADEIHNTEYVASAVAYTNAVVLNETIAWDGAAWGNALLALRDNYVPPAPPAPPKPAPAPQKQAAAPTGRGGSSGGSSVGGACGGATNGADAYIGRESGGNPNARNASGAWGCYQIMPGTWSSSCSDLGQHGSASTQAQAQCASRLPSNAWAASGG